MKIVRINSILISKSFNLQLFTLILYGVGIRCDRRRFSVHSPFTEKSMASEMFELVENRLYVYADDSTLQAVVRKTADRPAVAASLNRDLARIQEWGNHWCMILNPNKTNAWGGSRTQNPPHGDLVLSGVSI